MPLTLYGQNSYMKLGATARLYLLSGSHAVNSIYNRLLTPVLPLIVTEFDLSYAQAGLIVSAYSAGNSLFQYPLSLIPSIISRKLLRSLSYKST